MNFKTLLFIGALSALPSINDVHTTELEIAETNPTLAVPTADGFRISIDRIDELKDSETGEIVAARDQFIDFSFDIIGGQVTNPSCLLLIVSASL